MKKTAFIAHCPYEMVDSLKIILDKDTDKLSEETYRISDIITLHSLRSGEVTFKIIVQDYLNRDLSARNINDFKLIT